MINRKLTNPDAHHFDSFIELNISDKETKLTPVTLARDPSIREGGILANVTIEFLELEQNGEQTKPKMKDDKPVVLGMREVMNSYMAKVGRNTNYIIHPEEIMADNFSMAIMGRKTAPNPEILESVLKYFAKK